MCHLPFGQALLLWGAYVPVYELCGWQYYPTRPTPVQHRWAAHALSHFAECVFYIQVSSGFLGFWMLRKNPISCMVNVLACRANTTAVNTKPDSVAHFMFDAFVLGQSLCCGKRRPRTWTQITLKRQHLTIMHMLLAA